MNEELRRPTTPTVHSPVQMSDSRNRGSSKLPWVVLLIVVAVIIVVAIMFRDKWGGSDSGSMKASEYQAVFLTNGQVYFGKMANSHESYVTLKDIYYLQVQNPPIQGSQQQTQAQAQPQLSLVKLGNELHGPVDEMHINRDQILFFEDMKADGKVAQAIKEYKANPAGTGATPPAAPAPAPAPTPTPTPAAPAPAPAPTPSPKTQQ